MMRDGLLVVILVLACVSACVSDKLALAPPSGVDLSGRWQLNEADSDDPQRLVSSQTAGPGAAGAGSTGGQDGQGGRGGGRAGGRGGRGGGAMGSGGPIATPLPPVGTMSEGLRWPGKEVEIKQVAGVVAITSAGVSQVYQPSAQPQRPRRRKSADDAADGGAPRDRDIHSRDLGEGPPPFCGWDGKTLVVQSRDPDEDHPPFEERYSLSDDGQRLIEVVGFKGGRSAGFTMFRVWDRSPLPKQPQSAQ